MLGDIPGSTMLFCYNILEILEILFWRKEKTDRKKGQIAPSQKGRWALLAWALLGSKSQKKVKSFKSYAISAACSDIDRPPPPLTRCID
jgi:hypothetical protein